MPRSRQDAAFGFSACFDGMSSTRAYVTAAPPGRSDVLGRLEFPDLSPPPRVTSRRTSWPHRVPVSEYDAILFISIRVRTLDGSLSIIACTSVPVRAVPRLIWSHLSSCWLTAAVCTARHCRTECGSVLQRSCERDELVLSTVAWQRTLKPTGPYSGATRIVCWECSNWSGIPRSGVSLPEHFFQTASQGTPVFDCGLLKPPPVPLI